MAQLKDTLITGDLNVTEDAHAAKFYTKILMARQSDSSNTLSAGTAGYVLTSGGNAADVYWSEPLSLGNDGVHAAAGNHNHTTSIATSSGTNQLSLQPNTKYVLNAGGTSYVFTTPVDTTYVFDGTYNSSSNKAATVSTVTGAINNLTGIITGEPGSVKTVTSFSQTDGIVAIGFDNIAFPVTKVNGKTGDVNITANDLGLSKALKFIGVSSSIISDEGNQTPTVNNSTITPTTGDVVMYNSLEYFWDGSKWNELGDASSFALASHNHNISDILDFPTNLVTYTLNSNASVAGIVKNTYTYASTAIYAPNGLIMGGTAAAAGLVTRGICGVSVPDSTTGACTKENLYLNYDGDNSYRSTRQLVLQAGTIGTHYGNNVYQYAAVRGDAMKAWVEAKGYLTSYVDTKNTAGSTDISTKIFLIGASSQDVNPQTYSDNEVYATDGELSAKSHYWNVNGTEKVHIDYNSSTLALDFIFN